MTLLGKPITTLTSVPTLETAVSISFEVPRTCKSSLSRSTPPVPESPSTVRAVATLATPAAVSWPCALTVNVGI